MKSADPALQRLRNQHIGDRTFATPREVVSHLGAVQAQDYLGSLWAVGVRMRDAVEADIERALEDRSIVRMWPMRGTLHFVAAEDARWMFDLLAPRVLRRSAARLKKEFDLDPKVLRRCGAVFERALRDGRALTRPELYAALEKARIATGASRGLHILFALAHERLICFGPRRGKQPTFMLFDEWLPSSKPKPREESLAELARRYFNGHGPATIADFMWWSGLTAKEANEAIALGGQRPADRQAAGVRTNRVHLLPSFDEFTVAYKDRSAVLDPEFAKRVNAGGGIFNPIVVSDARVVGTWKRVLTRSAVEITLSPFRELTSRETRELAAAIERYGRFLERKATLAGIVL